jgi:hypothetical protein
MKPACNVYKLINYGSPLREGLHDYTGNVFENNTFAVTICQNKTELDGFM